MCIINFYFLHSAHSGDPPSLLHDSVKKLFYRVKRYVATLQSKSKDIITIKKATKISSSKQTDGSSFVSCSS